VTREDPGGVVRVVLISTSRAQDAGYLAARDVQDLAERSGLQYRLVGGIAVSLLTWVHGVADRVPARDTADADLGATHQLLADLDVVNELRGTGYRQVAGNRFERDVSHGDDQTLTLAIDVLAPGYESHLVANVPVGAGLVVDEIPGLPLALALPATWCAADVRLTTGTHLQILLPLPDVVAALCLKAFAYRDRFAPRDAIDIWRLLESAYAAGVRETQWVMTGARRDTAHILHEVYVRPGKGGPEQATLSPAQRQRIRALLTEVVPKP
jgi:hypothetical protein